MATQTYKGHTYGNGSLPKAILAPLDGNNYALPGDPAVLRSDAAESWNRARKEALAKTGIDLTVRGWMRAKSDQERFFFQRYKANRTSPFGDYRWYKGVRYGRTNGAAAAIPGNSNHGWGLAVDVNDFGGVGNFGYWRRVQTIGILKRHGWTDDEGRGKIQEPWHLVYNPARDTMKGKTPSKPVEKDVLDMVSQKDWDALVKKVDALHAGTAPMIDVPWKTKAKNKMTTRSVLAWVVKKIIVLERKK